MPILGWIFNRHLVSALWPVISSVVTAGHCKNKLLWPKFWAELVYRQKRKYLDSGLRIQHIHLTKHHRSFSTRACDFPSKGLLIGLQYQAWIPFGGTGLETNQKELGTPVGTPCLLWQQCYICRFRIWLWLLMTSFSVASITSSGQRGGHFHLSSSMVSLVVCNQSIWCLPQWAIPSSSDGKEW